MSGGGKHGGEMLEVSESYQELQRHHRTALSLVSHEGQDGHVHHHPQHHPQDHPQDQKVTIICSCTIDAPARSARTAAWVPIR